ncbi:MAG: hypothetical protein JRJ84_07395 [Deltaproteobacteria bacterium]|nr:hypothetical protein [Deltaproteobacteria bacterium]
MTRLAASTSLWFLCSAPALAGTVAVQVEVHQDEVPSPAVEAMVWHALFDRHGHDAVILDADDPIRRMRAEDLTTLYRFEVSWSPLTARLDGRGIIGSLAPTVQVEEYQLDGAALRPFAHWTIQGALALYDEIPSQGEPAIVSLPQIALQEAIGVAVNPVMAPIWYREDPFLDVPVELVADEEYRSFYGSRWKEVADLRLRRASVMLRQAGIQLEVVGHHSWTSPDDLHGLSDLLDALAATPRERPDSIRIAFTQQTDLATVPDREVEDVGRAYRPGSDVLVADQAMVPDHAPAWDEAEEASAITHEVLHALGVTHLEAEYFVMSPTKASTVHRLAPSTRALAQTAAHARYATSDPVHAVAALGAAAEAWLAEPESQIDYIMGNLAAGPGVPPPGWVAPGSLSALTNAAIARYYLQLAERDPDNTALWQSALAHSRAASTTSEP